MYSIWRACERLNIKPPNVKATWNECDIDVQALLLSYQQVREFEEFEILQSTMRVGI